MNPRLPKHLILSSIVMLAIGARDAAHASGSKASSLAPMPEAVTSFGAVTHDGWLYVCGGHKGERHEYSAEMVSGAFFRMRVSDGKTWEALPSTEPAQGAPLAAHGRYVYRVGGMAARNHAGETNDVHSKDITVRFDVERKVWEPLPPLPAPRSSHDAAIIGGKLYVGGGWELSGNAGKPRWHGTLLVLDLSERRPQWRSLSQPFERRGLAIAALDRKLYFIGGMGSDGKTTCAVDIFDTATGLWSKGPDIPDGQFKGFGCSAVAQKGRLYVNGYEGELARLSRSGDAWENAGQLQRPRFFHRLLPLGTTQLVAVGGEGDEGKMNDLELLSPVQVSSPSK